MKISTILTLTVLGLSISTLAQAEESMESPDVKLQKAESLPQAKAMRDPFQLPAQAREMGLANELNKLEPASGGQENQQ